MSAARCPALFATHRKLVSKGTVIHTLDSPSPWLHFCLQKFFFQSTIWNDPSWRWSFTLCFPTHAASSPGTHTEGSCPRERLQREV